MAQEPSISSVVIVDDHGERIAAKYYSDTLQSPAAQKKLEASLLAKGLKSSSTDEADIVLFEGHVAVMRAGSDVHLFVTGDQDENEIILVEVLNTMHEALTSLLGSLDSRRMMDKLEVVQLVIDELVDAGVILEIEASAIVNRVGMRGADAGPGTTSVIGAMQAAAAQSGSGGSAASAAMSFAEQMTRAFKATGTT